jgi:O-methyltransferase
MVMRCHAYDFSQSEIIADIGGGQGALLGQILRRTPNVQSILFPFSGNAR